MQSSKVVLQYSVQYMHDIHFKLTIKQILELCSLVDEPYSKSLVTLYGYSRCFIEGGVILTLWKVLFDSRVTEEEQLCKRKPGLG